MKLKPGDNLLASFRQQHPSLYLWAQTRRVELLLFVLLWGTFAYFYQSTQQNEAARFDQTRAITEEHRLAIDDYWWNSADVIRYSKNGRDYIYPNKAPGTTLMAVPIFWVITHLLKPLMAVGLPEWVYWHMVAYLTILFTISLLSALAAVAIYKVLVRMTDDSGFSVFAVLAIWLGTMAFPFSTLFFSHQQAAALLTIAFYLLFAVRWDAVFSSWRSIAFLFMAGALMGFSVTTEYPTALLVAILSVYGLWVIGLAGSRSESGAPRSGEMFIEHHTELTSEGSFRSETDSTFAHKWAPERDVPILFYKHRIPTGFFRQHPSWRAKGKLLAAFVLGLVIGGGFLLWYNIAAFGKIFYVPYEAYSKADSSFPVYSRGFLGMRWPGFGQFLHALAAITIKPPIGMLYIGVEHWRLYASSPVLWLVLPGVAIMLWRRSLRPEGLVVAAMIIAYLLFVTSYGNSIYDWSGAAYIGPRHIIPLLPFLALPIYYGGRKLRFVFYPFVAISVFYMLLATAIEPRVPYPFENPARDSFLPDYLHSRLAQNTDALFDPEHRKLTVDSTAFNLAKLARVPRPYQLAPLMLWWLIVGGALLVAAAPQSQLTESGDDGVSSPRVSKGASVDETAGPDRETEEQEDVNP